MNKKVFLILALLCAVVHGAWAKTEAGTKEAQLADVNNGGDMLEATVTTYSWDNVNKQLVKTQESKQCRPFGGQHEEDWLSLGEKDKTTWYYDGGESNIRYKALVIFGEVHLVLSKHTEVYLKHIKLEAKNNAKLHIHSADGGYGAYIEVQNWYSTQYYSAPDETWVESYSRHYENAAAVGGGNGENMGSLYMHGNKLSASIQDAAPAAIGGGKNGSIDPNHEIVVYAGTLEGKALLQSPWNNVHERNCLPLGAAIGGSDNHPQGGPITVYGGELCAVSDGSGAGIGGGEDSYGGTVNVYGGRVIVEKKWILEYGGAGIGGGYEGGGGDVHIYGGSVEVVGGKYGAAIGGYKGHGTGTIEFAPNLRVTAGDYDYENQKASPERVFTSGEREAACQWRRWAKIEACDHSTPLSGSDKTEAITYSIDDEIYHTKHCRYCNTTWQEEHQGTDCVCGKTSFYRFTVHHPGTEKDTYGESSTIAIGASADFYLPGCKNVPDGYTFKGWEMNPAPNDVNRWAAVRGGDPGTDTNIPAGTSVKTYLGQDKEVHFYARFLYDFTPTWTWSEDGSSASVTLSHKDLEGVTLSSTDATPKVTIEQEVLKDEADNAIGTRYTATCTYELNGYEYTFADNHDIIDVPATVDISLQDNADNSETISGKYNCPVNATLTGRTLYKDGSWNTLCLPFDLVLEGSPLAGATVKTLESSDYDISTGKLTLNFTTGSLTTLSAGTPYLVKWDKPDPYTAYDGNNASTCSDIVAPTFSGVTISAIEGGSAGSMYVDFVGSFSPVDIKANDYAVLYLGNGNKLYYPSQDRTMGSCRAVFRLHNGLAVGNPTAGARVTSFVMNLGDDETTGITTTNDANYTNKTDAWYDLQGRRVSGKPTAKGIYINNGKKVVIK